jgi:hypothetical protein
MSKVKWPWGAADSIAAAFSATIAATIANTKTLLTIAQLTGAATLNLTVSAEQAIGDELLVKTSVDGTGRTLTLGTSMSGLAQALTANKSYLLTFVFDGTNFVHKSTNLLN